MMPRYAVISSGRVVNVIIWDGESEFEHGGFELLPIPDGVGIGWTCSGDKFSAPATPEVSHDEMISQAEQQRLALKATADAEIDWRQFAVDKGIATDAETNALDEWSLYRVLLMRVDTSQAPDIEWPTPPAL